MKATLLTRRLQRNREWRFAAKWAGAWQSQIYADAFIFWKWKVQ